MNFKQGVHHLNNKEQFINDLLKENYKQAKFTDIFYTVFYLSFKRTLISSIEKYFLKNTKC